MCFACEQEQLMAAYQAYVASRRAAAAPQEPDGAAEAPETEDTGADWASGTWFADFAAAAERKE